ncbi:MAG: hypothetical protein ACM3MD_08770 [Betaproteobacteria bacterium]
MKQLMFILAAVLVSVSVTGQEKRFSVPLGDSPSLGPLNAPVTIVEFLDFQ